MSTLIQPDQATRSGGKSKSYRTEREFPYIVELPIPPNGLDVRLSREITLFHNQRDTPLRFGRTRIQYGQLYCRCCFSDPTIAEAFRARFVNDASSEY